MNWFINLLNIRGRTLRWEMPMWLTVLLALAALLLIARHLFPLVAAMTEREMLQLILIMTFFNHLRRS